MNRADMVRSIITWEQVSQEALRRAQDLRDQLAAMARAELENQGTAPTWRMPGLATVTLPVSKPSAAVENLPELTAWAASRMPHAVETITQIRPANLKALLAAVDLTGELPATEDGELIPGVVIRPGGIPKALTVRTDKAGAVHLTAQAEQVVASIAELLSTPIGMEDAA
jgi:hypothetical protein